MDKKKEIGQLPAEQSKLLCLMAYLGDTPGDYALKQLYGRNFSNAKRNLDILDHTPFTRGGKVAPDVFFQVVGYALDHFDIPAWAEKAQQFRTDTASWLWNVGTALHGQDAAMLRHLTRPASLRADLGEYLGENLLSDDAPASLVKMLTRDEVLQSIRLLLRVNFAEGSLTKELWEKIAHYADTSQILKRPHRRPLRVLPYHDGIQVEDTRSDYTLSHTLLYTSRNTKSFSSDQEVGSQSQDYPYICSRDNPHHHSCHRHREPVVFLRRAGFKRHEVQRV